MPVVVVVLALLLASPAAAWQGALKTAVRPIAQVKELAEQGDIVVVQGRIVRVETGSGSRYVVTLQDESGEVYVRVPEHLLRHVSGEETPGGGVTPQEGSVVRVGGKWTHGALDRDVWGIHAQTAERAEVNVPASPADARAPCSGLGCR